MGALHLTQTALSLLRHKGISISEDEYEATLIAILLHDVGHGPFSHALESVLVPHLRHEQMSLLIMQELNRVFNRDLELAIRIFEGQYGRPFFHELISSQLDMDRMDYLMRDSFYTGVQEGIVGTDRIIKTLNVHNDKLVVEEKGLYSVEKFIVARRLMYWQVYLHKTALVAENMLVQVLEMAREELKEGVDLSCDVNLIWLLRDADEKTEPRQLVKWFTAIDDTEIMYGLKQWRYAKHPILSDFCNRLIDRRLLKIRFYKQMVPAEEVLRVRNYYQEALNLPEEASASYVFGKQVSNRAYEARNAESIQILYKDGSTRDLADASDLANIGALRREVVKYYLCYPGSNHFPFPENA